MYISMLEVRKYLFFLWLGVILMFVGVIDAEGAGLQITPVHVYMQATSPRATVVLKNDEDTPILFQIEAVTWAQHVGESIYKKTSDFIITPSVITIQPKDKQMIRLGLRKPTSGMQEQAYRLIFTEVDTRKTQPEGVSLRMLLRITVPVFIEPKVKNEVALWTAKKTKEGKLEIKLQNQGNVHLGINEMSVYANGQEKPFVRHKAPDNVLPGQHQTWTFNAVPNMGTSVKVQIRTDRGITVEHIPLSAS